MAPSGSMDRAWKVLSGKEDPRFSSEHQLRFFQAMYFITGGDRTDRKLFIDAAITFASESIKLQTSKDGKSRPSENIMRFIGDKNNKCMFDACFRSIDILNENNPRPFNAEVDYRESYSMEINHYAYLTDIRMSVFDRTGKDSITAAGKMLTEQSLGKSAKEELQLKGEYTRRKANKLKSKAAYLCAAKACKLESLYTLSQKETVFENLLSINIPEPREFMSFYKTAICIADKLDLKISPSMRRIVGTNDLQYRPFFNVSMTDIDELTKKSSAGRVTHKKPAGE